MSRDEGGVSCDRWALSRSQTTSSGVPILRQKERKTEITVSSETLVRTWWA
jgi:hypothetical protein